MLLRRLRTFGLSGAAVLTLMLGVSAPVVATPVNSDGAVQISWDASDGTSGTTESFFSVPTVIPGDSAHRSLTVRNAGPSDGTLTARIVNVELSGTSTGASFYDDLQIRWADGSASMRELSNNRETQILEAGLSQDAETEVALEYFFPLDASSGAYSKSGAHTASFDVEFQIRGDLSASGTDSSGDASDAPGPQAVANVPAGSNDQSGITVPLGLTNDTTESAATPESRLDTGELVLVGSVQNWPLLITATLVGVGWAAMRGFRTRPRSY